MFQNRILCVFCWAYFIFHQCLWFLLRQMIDYHIFSIFSKQQHLINRKMYHIANLNNGTHKPLLTIPNKIFLDFDIWPNIVCIPLHLHLLFLFIPLNWYWNQSKNSFYFSLQSVHRLNHDWKHSMQIREHFTRCLLVKYSKKGNIFYFTKKFNYVRRKMIL